MKKFVYYVICVVAGFIILFAISGLLVAIGGDGPSYLFLIIVFSLIAGFCKLIKDPFYRFWERNANKNKTNK